MPMPQVSSHDVLAAMRQGLPPPPGATPDQLRGCSSIAGVISQRQRRGGPSPIAIVSGGGGGGGGGGGATLLGVGSTLDTYTSYPVTGEVTNGDWYVDPTSNTNGSGTEGNPFNDLHSAIAAASINDVILVKAGTLQPTTKYSVSTAGLKIYAYGSDRPIINASSLSTSGSAPVPIYITGDNQHWKGFDVIGVQATSLGYDIGGVRVHQASGCKVEDFRYYNSVAGGFYAYAATNTIFQDCIYYGVNSSGFGTNAADGFASTGNSTGTKMIRDFAANGCDDGFDFFTGSGNEILSCVAYRCGYLPGTTQASSGDGNGFKCGGTDALNNLVKGNLSIANRVYGFDDNLTNNGNDYIQNTAVLNDIYGINTGQDPASIVNDNIALTNATDRDGSGVSGSYNTWNLGITDAQFADVANYDWSLDTGSPCIGAGISGGNLGASEEALILAKTWIPIVIAFGTG